MTREQIEQMPAGREMDRLIAEKVMGWKPFTLKNGYEYWEAMDSFGDSRFIPVDSFKPSDGLVDTWDAIRRIRELQPTTDLLYMWEGIFVELTGWKWFLLSAEAFCLNTCRAALIVMLELEKE